MDSSVVDPVSLGVMPLTARKALRVGFDIGGKNPTALIRTLTKINGWAIAELEPDMRPGALSGMGFLGKDESLIDVLATDNMSVVDEHRHGQRAGSDGAWRGMIQQESCGSIPMCG